MKLINKVLTASILTVGLFANQTAIAAETWNNDVETYTYNFSKYIGNTYVQKAIVKSGTVETDYSWAENRTQVTAIVNTGGCDAYSKLYLTMEAELTDPDTGEYISESTSFYPPEMTNGHKINVMINDVLEWPEDGKLALSFTTECY